MKGFFQRLYWLFACSSQEDLVITLLQQIEFLRAEKEMLRSRLPKPFRATLAERTRLLQLGKVLGWAVVKELITVVTPRTFAHWVADEKKSIPPRRRGRPRKPFNLRELVLKLALENTWGYGRILGELKKLYRGKICKSTVKNILQENGIDPSPRRGHGTWAQFISSHAQTLWACDFLTQPVLTFRGWVDYYVVLFIHIESRRIFVSPATAHPTGTWVSQQARNFLIHVDEQSMPITHLIRDHDGKFQGMFDTLLETAGAKVVTTAIRAPNMNAYAERAIQTLQVECLNHFVVIGEKHLNYLTQEFSAHYHQERPHQGKGNVPLTPPPPEFPSPEFPGVSAAPPPARSPPLEDSLAVNNVRCKTRLGGVLKHYYRPRKHAA